MDVKVKTVIFPFGLSGQLLLATLLAMKNCFADIFVKNICSILLTRAVDIFCLDASVLEWEKGSFAGTYEVVSSTNAGTIL